MEERLCQSILLTENSIPLVFYAQGISPFAISDVVMNLYSFKISNICSTYIVLGILLKAFMMSQL